MDLTANCTVPKKGHVLKKTFQCGIFSFTTAYFHVFFLNLSAFFVLQPLVESSAVNLHFSCFTLD